MTDQRIRQALIILIGVIVTVLIAGAFMLARTPSVTENAGTVPVVRDDSHVLSQAPEEKAVLVEFLDFECEACRAVYPTVEELRAEYAQELTIVLRYFPMPGHANAENAALAVEAAARQGQLDAMYSMMYATQGEWGESRDSKADVFRGFAEDLGLDLDQYDQDVADPAVLERVTSDFDDGLALGVSGTPTFFLDGERVTVTSTTDLRTAVEAALAQ